MRELWRKSAWQPSSDSLLPRAQPLSAQAPAVKRRANATLLSSRGVNQRHKENFHAARRDETHNAYSKKGRHALETPTRAWRWFGTMAALFAQCVRPGRLLWAMITGVCLAVSRASINVAAVLRLRWASHSVCVWALTHNITAPTLTNTEESCYCSSPPHGNQTSRPANNNQPLMRVRQEIEIVHASCLFPLGESEGAANDSKGEWVRETDECEFWILCSPPFALFTAAAADYNSGWWMPCFGAKDGADYFEMKLSVAHRCLMMSFRWNCMAYLKPRQKSHQNLLRRWTEENTECWKGLLLFLAYFATLNPKLSEFISKKLFQFKGNILAEFTLD